MKKLLIATDSFLPRWDGIARFLIELIPKLRSHFKITVVAPNFIGKEVIVDDVTVERIAMSKFSVGDYQVPKMNKDKIKELVKDADVVFTQSIGPIGSLAIREGHAQKKPVVAFIHSIEWELVAKSISPWKIVEKGVHFIVKEFIKGLYNKCSLIITPSREVSEIMKKNKIKTLKTVVHLGIDTKKFRPPEDKGKAKHAIGLDQDTTVIGYVGRVSREKDLITLIRAFKTVRLKHKKIKLVIVGGGIESHHKYFSQQEDVMAVGQKENVAPYLQAMDIFVLPSLTETTSLSTMEAMSCGCAVVVTKVGYLKYYINDKENGIFFPKRNEVILGLKLDWLIKNEYVRKTLGGNARKTIVQHYNWEDTAERVKDILFQF